MLEEQLKDLVKQEQDALSAIQDLTDEIAENILAAGDIDPIALASLRSRHQKESEKYDDLVPDNLLNAEYAQSHLDVEGMMTYLKSRLL